jgi:hypothetical protein
MFLGCLFACAAWLVCGSASPGAIAQDTVAAAKDASKTSGTASKSSAATPKKTTANSTRSKPSSSAASRKGKPAHTSSRHGRRKTAARGQQKIDPERAQEIQEALVREHYLSGEAAGTWNQASEDAMRRYQSDHGWQSKAVPDSRALISLGLGPSHDHLLNPDSAMTSEPAVSHTRARVAAPLVPVSSPLPAAKVQPDSTTGSQSAPGDSSRPQ